MGRKAKPKPVVHNSCTVQRIIVRKHYTMSLNGSELQPAGPDTIATEACNIPLFDDGGRADGICRSCRKGWEVESNKFASDAERKRATT